MLFLLVKKWIVGLYGRKIIAFCLVKDPFLYNSFYKIWAKQQTDELFHTVSDFIDGSDLYTLWRQEKKLDDTTVKLYSAELVVTLGQRSFWLEFQQLNTCNTKLKSEETLQTFMRVDTGHEMFFPWDQRILFCVREMTDVLKKNQGKLK